MRIVKRKWLKSSMIFLIISIIALMMAATALAQGPGPKPDSPMPHGMNNPGPMKPEKMEMCVGGEITGVAWYDGNGNNRFNPNNRNPRRGEHYMDGAIVHLWAVRNVGPEGKGHAQSIRVGTFITRDGGAFKFECVRPGLYSLQVIPPPSHVVDTLTLPHTENPTVPFEVKGGEELVFAFAFKPYLEFTSYPYLNEPPRLDS